MEIGGFPFRPCLKGILVYAFKSAWSTCLQTKGEAWSECLALDSLPQPAMGLLSPFQLK